VFLTRKKNRLGPRLRGDDRDVLISTICIVFLIFSLSLYLRLDLLLQILAAGLIGLLDDVIELAFMQYMIKRFLNISCQHSEFSKKFSGAVKRARQILGADHYDGYNQNDQKLGQPNAEQG